MTKAYQVWLVARDPATLQDLGRALLQESDSRENCEIYNEALTVADKVNLARSYFGRALHARKPLYVVQTLPAPSNWQEVRPGFGPRIKGVMSDPSLLCVRCGGPSGHSRPGRCHRCGDSLGIVEHHKVIVTRGIEAMGEDVVRVNLAELKCDPLPPIRAAAPWIEGEVVPSPQICQCGAQQYVMPGSGRYGRCGRCGRAIK